MPLHSQARITAMTGPQRLHIPLLRVLVITQVMCVAIAVLLALLGNGLRTSLLYSLCIGNVASLLINLGRYGIAHWLLARPGPHPPDLHPQWPGWRWMLPLVLVGGTLGYLVGSWLAQGLGGSATMKGHSHDWQGWLAIFIISTTASLGITWFFFARARIAASEAAAAAAARLAAETQLKLLESQLEPHMLFNTLANLRALIGVDPQRAQAMLDRIIDFLRATLNASRVGQHRLADEYARLADYLALMQIRMGERLQVMLDLPPELADCAVPPLLLQPLVENAIKHGLEPQRGGGRLRISAEAEGAGRLRLCVSDSGAGLSALAPQAGSTPGAGFGLGQVRDRLATLYGAEASLALTALPEGGTLACVVLPRSTHITTAAKPS